MYDVSNFKINIHENLKRTEDKYIYIYIEIHIYLNLV